MIKFLFDQIFVAVLLVLDIIFWIVMAFAILALLVLLAKLLCDKENVNNLLNLNYILE